MKWIFEFIKQNKDTSQHVLIALGIILLFWLLARLAYYMVRVYGKRMAAKTATTLDDELVGCLEKPIKSYMLILGAYIANKSLVPLCPSPKRPDILYPPQLINTALFLLTVFVGVLFIKSSLKIIIQWSAEKSKKVERIRVARDFSPLLHRVAMIVVYLIAVGIILNYFHQDISSIIVSLGVGSIAIGLAAQETLSNMIAGFLIMFDKPFRIGDRLELENGTIGDVVDIGIRTTRIKTFYNTILIVPNSYLTGHQIINHSYPDSMVKVQTDVGVAYGSDIQRVKEVLLSAVNNIPEILEAPQPGAFFMGFGDSAINFRVQGWVKDYKEAFAITDLLRTEVYNKLNEASIEIPFPIQTVLLKSLNKN